MLSFHQQHGKLCTEASKYLGSSLHCQWARRRMISRTEDAPPPFRRTPTHGIPAPPRIPAPHHPHDGPIHTAEVQGLRLRREEPARRWREALPHVWAPVVQRLRESFDRAPGVATPRMAARYAALRQQTPVLGCVVLPNSYGQVLPAPPPPPQWPYPQPDQ